MSISAEPVIDYLLELQKKGQTHISVDDEARVILREFYKRAHSKAEVANRPANGPRNNSQASIPQRVVNLPVSETVVSPAPKQESLQVKGDSVEDKMLSLKQQTMQLPAARALGTFRQTMVFSAGSLSADVMLIGEAPAYDDERLGEPFVGKAGKKLDGILLAMGLSREACYLTNIVKFRPSMPNQTTSNRKPSAEEVAACLPVLSEEIKLVAPKVIIALGTTPAQALLSQADSISELRGKPYQHMGIPLQVTYHPSYILHDGVTPEKRQLWEDMLAVMELLKLPISEKQRGYFLPK